ncbi:MAG TPA: ABC transporter permease [Candidatus Limnocylindrales bacterium]|jgi:ABC-2 type transport system permease protein
MTSLAAGATETAAAGPEAPEATTRSIPRRGWLVVATKEFGDHVSSMRFIVLLIVLGLAAVIPLYFASDQIRGLASQATGTPAIFLFLFTLGPQTIPFLRVDVFVSIVAPLLGIAFAFDAVNGERAAGTLPRLMSQPIYRDDVINGKFAAGLAAISLVLALVVVFIAGFGLWRLGVVPSPAEVMRLITWLGVTVIYVSLWLAFGLLLSVVIRRAASAALVGFGVWVLVAVFGSLIVNLVAGVVAPVSGLTKTDFANAGIQQLINRLLPITQYREISLVVLNPSITSTSTPATLSQAQQLNQQVEPTLRSLDQSLLLAWPELVALVALTVVFFTIAYIRFMRQEVRA